MSDARVFYFGCWNLPERIAEKRIAFGHYWHAPGNRPLSTSEEDAIPFDADIDGGYAPREWRGDCFMYRNLVPDPSCCFAAQGDRIDDYRQIKSDTNEFAQGAYLVHHVRDWTLMSWWDRAQGDTRPACNSGLLAFGTFEADKMFELLCEHFPHVVRNLANAGVVLHDAKAKNGR